MTSDVYPSMYAKFGESFSEARDPIESGLLCEIKTLSEGCSFIVEGTFSLIYLLFKSFIIAFKLG